METDDGQFIWSDWEPDAFISAFRRMMEVCRAEAPNINIVWSPIGQDNALDYYPGDEYVDLVGLSIFGYEPWEVAILGGAQTYSDVLTKRYNVVKGVNKPVFVAELGYSGSQAYVDSWEGEVRLARPDLPLLVGVAYFHQKEVYSWPDGFGTPDWRIENRVLD
jgi:endoglucanase